MATSRDTLPAWLATSEQYRPGTDRDGFVTRNVLQVSALLARLRLDDGREERLSPSAPAKLLVMPALVLLVSLSRNYLFVLVMLAAVLVRACLLPRDALARVMGTSTSVAGLTALVMLPSALFGQAHAPALLATKAFVCTAVVLTVALTTPASLLTRSLRRLGIPAVGVLMADLALRSIVRLGETAREVLTALTLRSVGRNPRKRAAIGGVGGVVLLKASRSSQESYDAMRCRGFDGSYQAGPLPSLRRVDALWLAAFACCLLLFFHLQGAA